MRVKQVFLFTSILMQVDALCQKRCRPYIDSTCLNGYECLVPVSTGKPDCLDINECLAGIDTCDSANGICTNTQGSYSCACKTGYVGDGETCLIDCGAVPTVSDGNVAATSSSTLYGSNATVTCNTGYEADKNQISCQADGLWETPTCTIVDCGAVPTVSNGTVAAASGSTVYESNATVTCNTGYEADKNPITCQADGLWETPACTIVDCGAVPTVSNGTVAAASGSTVYESNATVTCNTGYEADKNPITCQADGLWETPACTIVDCGAVPTVSNGTVAAASNSTLYGSTATVTCDIGYEADKTPIICQADGLWETPACTIVECLAGWTEYNNNCYYVDETNSKKWNDAESECQKYPASLVKITSKEENNYVKSLFPGSSKAWIGLSDKATESTWKWTDGSIVDYVNWALLEPSNTKKEYDCAEIQSDGSWKDNKCSESGIFICEYVLA